MIAPLEPLELIEIGPDAPARIRNRWAAVNGPIVVAGSVVKVLETDLTVFVPSGFEVVRGRQTLLAAVAAGKRTGLFVEKRHAIAFGAAAVVYRSVVT